MPTRNTFLPGSGDQRFITDGGLETTLIFQRGLELPNFASFPLLETDSGREILREYFQPYTRLADAAGLGFIFESPTWRSNPRWGQLMGYDADALDAINRRAIEFMQSLRASRGEAGRGDLVSGCIGPRDDGYVVADLMTVQQSRDYHRAQAASFAAAGADMVTAMTLNYVAEATGVALAVQECGLPSVISFTTETDGRLPDGTTLAAAIEAVDEATGAAPAYYMVNCAHPDHFRDVLARGETWVRRIGGLRTNASRMSHAELDNAEVLDDGDPVELGQLCLDIQAVLPHIRVLGGCCGTDHRHVGQMCRHAA